MATTVSRSLPDGICQGHQPMPDQLVPAIRSLSDDNAGHVMTGTSPGTGPVTDDRSVHRPVIGYGSGHRSKAPITSQRRPFRSTVTGLTNRHRSSVTDDRSDPPVRGHLLLMTGPTHRSTYYRSPVNTTDRSGHRSVLPSNTTGHRGPVRSLGMGYWSPDTGQHAPIINQSTVASHQSTIRNRGSPSSDYSTSLSSNAYLSSTSFDYRVLIPVIVMIIIDHLDHHGNDTRGDAIPVVAVLAHGDTI
ncbi:hypothetical protein DPMN_129589 [Dreissena polymorpha]|uniref:Uncharacterized protein n=1 Tax=Dreissena polymorpha TaxID=45954 RepID=A0A9D4H1F7_DREPO|nr:hypothetical protein DPMN_129589 [Dreissena polymorpha]